MSLQLRSLTVSNSLHLRLCQAEPSPTRSDNAQSSRKPVEWQLPKIWIVSTILGVLLAVGTWIMRGVLFISDDGKGGIIQNYGSIQEILFLEVALTESWLILVTRSKSTSLSLSPINRELIELFYLTVDTAPVRPRSTERSSSRTDPFLLSTGFRQSHSSFLAASRSCIRC